MFTAKEDRPPYVTFEQVAVEDRDASIKAGHYVARDEDYARIMPVGGDVIVREVQGWFENITQHASEGRFNPEWVEKFKQSYKLWKQGLEIPLEGTPLKNWPGLSPAQYQTLNSLRVFTVEDLANANEQVLRSLLGGHSLQERAQAYLATCSDSGKVAEENASLKAQLKDLQEANSALTSTNKALSLEIAALKPKG